jgi:hypothetical protein
MVNGEYRISSFDGRLSIVFGEGERDEITLSAPLLFKFRKNWAGDGRKVNGITNGHYIVIAPTEWERIGHVRVEPEGCADTSFTAHYFFRDEGKSAENTGGFQGYEVVLITSGFELSGDRVFDDSEDGELFVSAVPNLKLPSNITWVRVGEEKKNGWKGQNFEPEERILAKALNGRQGRFFIRVYDSEPKLLDTGEFRYLRDLKEILVNGEPYTEQTILLPPSTGYPPTKVRFIGVDGVYVRPILPPEIACEMQGGDLVVEPHPEADRISCALESDTGRVDIELNLPCIWWRIGKDGESGEWRATPLVMTRGKFPEHARAEAAVWLRLPPRLASVKVGFDGELDRTYRPKKKGEDIEIPLANFVDYSQNRPATE